uniref:Uncharacterized protein n=1 Tax=Romanomermis culicivorax TaxID=13658 RepID=A0A915KH15_ROMCU
MFEDAIAWSKSTKISKEHTHPATGATPVHVAAAKGYCKVLRILLQAGAEVNAKDRDGWTPLHAAAHWGEREACEILVEHNANFQEINNMGMTCVDVADPDLIEFLESLQEKQKITQSLSRNVTRRPTTMPSTANNARTHISEPQSTIGMAPPPPSSPSVHLPSWRLTGRRAIGPIPTSMTNVAPKSSVQQIPAAPVFRQISSSPSVPNTPLESPPPIDPKMTPSSGLPTTTATSVSNEIRKRTEALNSSPSTSFAAEDKKNNAGINGQRAEESEAERKLRAKRERESRRSTQGVTLETVKAAEHFFKKSTDESSNTITTTNTNNVEKSSQLSSSKNECDLSSVQPTTFNTNKDSDKNRSSSSSSFNDEKSMMNSRLNANLTTALKNLDEFQNANNGPFGKMSKITTKKNVQDNKNIISQNANDIHTRERDKFSAKFIPGDSDISTASNLSKVNASSLEKTASSNISSSMAAPPTADSASSSLSNSRAARRIRANRRSTGPIAQDDVHLAFDETEKTNDGNEEIIRVGTENSNKNKENNTEISTTNNDKHVTVRSNNFRGNGSTIDKKESNNLVRRPLLAKFESSDAKNGRPTNPPLPKPAFNY